MENFREIRVFIKLIGILKHQRKIKRRVKGVGKTSSKDMTGCIEYVVMSLEGLNSDSENRRIMAQFLHTHF